MSALFRFAEIVWTYNAKAPIRQSLFKRLFHVMKYVSKKAAESGKLGWILLWLVGVPVPLLLLLFLLRGCT